MKNVKNLLLLLLTFFVGLCFMASNATGAMRDFILVVVLCLLMAVLWFVTPDWFLWKYTWPMRLIEWLRS